jgi:hypothetical protein
VTIPGTNVAARSLAEAIQCLEPYSADSHFADLIRRLESLQRAHEAEPPEPDRDGRAAEALADVQSISKSENVPLPIRNRAERAARALQFEHLAKMSPAAAEAWRTRQAL